MKIALLISDHIQNLNQEKKSFAKLHFIRSFDLYQNKIDPNILLNNNYDVLFYDMNLFKFNGRSLYQLFKQNKIKSKIVLLTNEGTEVNFKRLHNHGICGSIVINKNALETANLIAELLRQFLLNNVQTKPITNNPNFILLTDREKQILKLFVNGFSYKEVGNQLDVKLDTVRSHIRNMYRKLNVRSKTEAVMKIIETGIID